MADQPRDQRDPGRQWDPTHQTKAGRRATDPVLDTRDCADDIGVGTEFIVDEIHDGRLAATVISRGLFRKVYRIAPADWAAYKRRFLWRGRIPDTPDPSP